MGRFPSVLDSQLTTPAFPGVKNERLIPVGRIVTMVEGQRETGSTAEIKRKECHKWQV